MTERVPITVRLTAEDKAVFEAGANAAGLEGGTAARQIIELAVKRMRETGDDFVDVLVRMKNALKETA